MVVGSGPIGIDSTTGAWLRPTRGHVLVFVEVDHVSNPAGALRRPRHFHVPWSHLQPLEGCCDTPGGPGATFWFRQGGHVLGYIVYAAAGTTAATRRRTERMLDSLRIR
jgi:hypothetical protein